MRYLLDTNICIYLLKDQYNVASKIESVGIGNCYISEITLAELYYGAANSGRKNEKLPAVKALEELFTPLSVRSSLEIYGEAKTDLRQKGLLIDDFDLLIGATAIANDMIMVTENIKHLSRIQGIIVENWIKRM